MPIPPLMRRPSLLILLCLLLSIAGCATIGGPRRAEPPLSPPETRGEFGIASIYANRFRGSRTASGERYDPDRLTAAHRVHPFGTRLLVTNLSNDLSVIVTVNDRGPFRRGRIVDLSRRAARAIRIGPEGLSRVRVDVID